MRLGGVVLTLGSLLLAGHLLGATPAAPPGDLRPSVAAGVKVTVLSTMLADTLGIGEWGFAALVEVDGYKLLFDTGERPETVLRNAAEMGIDLSTVTDVVLSHHHGDHTGGLLTLRHALQSKNPAALSRAHVAPGIFQSRRNRAGGEGNPMIALRADYEATGGEFIEHAAAAELAPGVWLTGPVARRFAERNWVRTSRLVTGDGVVEDSLPEDQALIVRTGRGLTLLTGCGHAGIGNLLAHAQTLHPRVPVRAVLGGLHLLEADEAQLRWTASRMRAAGVRYLLGAHCTGLEAVYRLRSLAGLTRKTAVVGAVASRYADDTGLSPGWLPR
jgi:7,8-dihydropterin-6-yl-methyl-4-(beta-D-ribofuranosyl)aminobenzene 5'-phosphate synthase